MRRFPRNAQSRADALAGPGHLHQHYIRNTLGRKAEDARYAQAAVGTVAVLATGTAHACNESDIVAGGKVLTLTISGPDRFTSAKADFLAAVPATDGLRAALTVAAITFSADMKRAIYTLPAFGGYTIASNASYDFALPAGCFHNSNAGLTVTAAIVVTEGA